MLWAQPEGVTGQGGSFRFARENSLSQWPYTAQAGPGSWLLYGGPRAGRGRKTVLGSKNVHQLVSVFSDLLARGETESQRRQDLSRFICCRPMGPEAQRFPRPYVARRGGGTSRSKVRSWWGGIELSPARDLSPRARIRPLASGPRHCSLARGACPLAGSPEAGPLRRSTLTLPAPCGPQPRPCHSVPGPHAAFWGPRQEIGKHFGGRPAVRGPSD